MDDIVKGLLWDTLVGAAITALLTAIGAPWLSPILSPIIRLFTDKLFEIGRAFISIEVKKVITEQNRKEFDRRAIELYELAQSGVDPASPQFMEKRREHAKALQKFIQWY